MSDSFYRSYEDRYRGSRDLIKSRLRAYADFIAPLAILYHPAVALDLGCGRGEWLELLGEAGFVASGVDLDEGMLAACRERALNVEMANAVSSLRALPNDSMALVSAFHLVEHIPFAEVQTLIREALRVLQPGGLLIMETPNPENLVVGASSFYMDPSHVRPVPPQLLEFVVEYSGFLRQKIVRLQESPQLHTAAPIGLINVLDGVSPDYAVVAQKSAAPDVLTQFDAPFQADYGIALAALAQRYEHQQEQRRAELHVGLAQLESRTLRTADVLTQQVQRLATTEERLTQADAHATQRLATIEDRLTQADAHATERLAIIEDRLTQAETHATQLGQRIVDLLSSRSWRVTAPLRLMGTYTYRVRSAVQQDRLGSGIKRRTQGALLRLAHWALRRPRLKQVARRFLYYIPGLQSRLYAILHQSTMASQNAPTQQQSDLSPRTLRMYRELKKSLDARKN